MKSFTPSHFRSDSSKVYNEVMINGITEIDHRDRPKMLLMTVDHYEAQLERHFHQQKAICDLIDKDNNNEV